MNRRNFFRGAVASLFAFVGAKFIPKPKTTGISALHSIGRPLPPFSYIYTYGRDRVKEGVINVHIDQLAMGINPMYVRRKSITEQAYEEVGLSDIRVYRNTGKCDLNSLKKEETT